MVSVEQTAEESRRRIALCISLLHAVYITTYNSSFCTPLLILLTSFR